MHHLSPRPPGPSKDRRNAEPGCRGNYEESDAKCQLIPGNSKHSSRGPEVRKPEQAGILVVLIAPGDNPELEFGKARNASGVAVSFWLELARRRQSEPAHFGIADQDAGSIRSGKHRKHNRAISRGMIGA
jgi:hypothetical protein